MISPYNIFLPNWFYAIKKHIFVLRMKTNNCCMNLLLCLKRPFIWLSRFRYRCGYGVHSPFAFSLITDVIYEKMPYYAYFSLKEEQKKMIKEQGWCKGIQKVNRFLFRLVNRVQPATIIEVGPYLLCICSRPNPLPGIFLLPTCRSCFWMLVFRLIFYI